MPAVETISMRYQTYKERGLRAVRTVADRSGPVKRWCWRLPSPLFWVNGWLRVHVWNSAA